MNTVFPAVSVSQLSGVSSMALTARARPRKKRRVLFMLTKSFSSFVWFYAIEDGDELGGLRARIGGGFGTIHNIVSDRSVRYRWQLG